MGEPMGVAIRRKCDLCGVSYVAKSKQSKFCTPACRQRKHAGMPPRHRPQPAAAEPSNRVTAETTATLTALGKLNTPEGQAVLVLAAKIDAAIDPLSAITAATKQLGDTLANLRREAPAEADPLDELRKRREARQRGA